MSVNSSVIILAVTGNLSEARHLKSEQSVMLPPKCAHLTTKSCRHKKARHQGGYMCDHCAKSFGQALDLREHIQMIHKGQPLNLKCKHCDKTFHSRKARLRHVNLDHFPDRYVDQY